MRIQNVLLLMECAVIALVHCSLRLNVMQLGSLQLEMVPVGDLICLSSVMSRLTCSFDERRPQHMFLDPAKPPSACGMSNNCVNFSGNQRSFNDGYHGMQHLNSKLHWTQLPQHFFQAAEQGNLPGALTEWNDSI